MANYFYINGYFKEKKDDLFTELIVKDTAEVDEGEEEAIFHFGLSESKIKEAISKGENSDLPFVITEYEPCDLF